MKKRFVSLVLAISMLLAMFPFTAISAVEIVETEEALTEKPSEGLIAEYHFDGNYLNSVDGVSATPVGKMFSEPNYPDPTDPEKNWFKGVSGEAYYSPEYDGLRTINPGDGDFSYGIWISEITDSGIVPYVWYGGINQSPECWIGLWNVDVYSGWERNGITVGSNDAYGARLAIVPTEADAFYDYDSLYDGGLLLQWTHFTVTAVLDEESNTYTVTMYVNGVEAGSCEGMPNPYTGDPEGNGDYLYLNVDAWPDFTSTGAYDEFVVYNRALSGDEVASLYGSYEEPKVYSTVDEWYGDLTSHSFIEEITIQATCSVAGEKTYTCDDCDLTYTVEYYEDHDLTEEITGEGTCAAPVISTITCSNCGYFKENVLAADHDLTEEITGEGSCVSPKTATYTCSLCDYFSEEILEEAHTLNPTYSGGGTCQDPTYCTEVCDLCGYTNTWEYTADHDISTVIEGEGTCESPEITTETCSLCDYNNSWISRSEHDYVAEITGESTCVDKAIAHCVCSVCGGEYDRDIYGSHEYDENGLCENCGQTKGETVNVTAGEWWSAWTPSYKLEDVLFFEIEHSGEMVNNYDSITVLFSNSELTGTMSPQDEVGDAYVEHGAIRSDNWGWPMENLHTSSNYDFDQFIRIMSDCRIYAVVQKTDSKIVLIYYAVSPDGESFTYHAFFDFVPDGDIYVQFTGENCEFSVTPVTPANLDEMCLASENWIVNKNRIELEHNYNIGTCIICGDSPDEIEPDTEYTAIVSGNPAYFSFTPEVSHKYFFRSFADGEDTHATIYNSDMTEIASNDDYGGLDFGIEIELEAGQTYYLEAKFLNDIMAGSFPVMLSTVHSYESDYIVEATCSVAGTKKYSCTDCDSSYEKSYYLAHDYANGACSVCGADYHEIELDVEYTVDVTEEIRNVWFKFVPEVSDIYYITSYSDRDTCCSLFDFEFNELAFSDDNYDSNFGIFHYLEAGQTYYFETHIYDDAFESTFPVLITINHSYSMEIIEEGNCIEAGLAKYTCVFCEYSYEDSHYGEHTYETTIVTEGTCVTEGEMHHYCSLCGFNSIEYYFTDHSYECEIVNEADCQNDGLKRYDCENCDSWYEELYYGEHSYVDGICEVCGFACTKVSLDTEYTVVITEDNSIIFFEFTPEFSHTYLFRSFADGGNTYGALYRDPTESDFYSNTDYIGYDFGIEYYLEAGVTYYFGVSFENSEETGSFPVKLTVLHKYDSLVTDEATCSEAGTILYSCSQCDESYEEAYFAAHSYVNGVCEICGANCPELQFDTETDAYILEENTVTYFSFTPEISHIYLFKSYSAFDTWGAIYDENGELLIDNDDYDGNDLNFGAEYYLEAGKTYYLATRYLSDSKKGSYPVKISYIHSYEEEIIEEATCTETGIKKFVCTCCDHSYEEEYILNHSYDNGVCSDCGYEAALIGSGECGEDLSWELKEDGILKITGTGEMFSYVDPVDYSWHELRKAITSVVIEDGATNISDFAFYGCFDLESVELPDSITEIGHMAFYYCQSLIEIELPENLISIGENAFAHCISLMSIEIPSKVETIGYGCFFSCDNLLEVTLSESMTRIESHVFAFCPVLYEITIPASITYIDEFAFGGCHKLCDVYYLGTEEQWSSVTVTEGNDPLLDATMHYSGCGTSGHSWNDATCTAPKTCSVCGEIEGDELGHSWNDATCTAPKTCSVCGETEGDELGHSWNDATCTAPKTCSVCGETEGEKLDHTWKNGSCSSCGQPSPTSVKITTQPKTTYTTMGSKVKVPVTATGDGLTYTWYVKSAGSSSFSKSSVKTATYGTTMSSSSKDRQVYCVITDKYGNKVQTNTVYLREAVSITEQPTDAVVTSGTRAYVTFTASGDGLTYTWYYKNSGATKFSKTTTFTTNTYSAVMDSTRRGRQVYCVITDKYGNEVQTNTVTLGEAVSITKQPTDVAVTNGTRAYVTFTASGDGLTYTWYYKNSGATKFSKTTTFTTNTYSAVMDSTRRGRQVYCVITDKYGNEVQTNTVTLGEAVSITKQPTDVAVTNGTRAYVTFTASGEGLTYTWYYKNSGATKFSKTTTFTTNTYSAVMDSTRRGRQVYCVITDKYGNKVQTNTVILGEAVSITNQPTTTNTKMGATVKVPVTASGDGLTYTWYVKSASATKFAKSSVTSATYSTKMSSSSKDRQVYCVITDEYGNSVTTNTVYLREKVSITKQPASVSVANGATAKVTLTASGDGLTYTWYYKNSGSSSFIKTTSFTGNTYSVKMNSSRSGRQIYCVVTDEYGNKVQTATVTLTMTN